MAQTFCSQYAAAFYYDGKRSRQAAHKGQHNRLIVN